MTIGRRAALALPALALPGLASAQPTWPDRPVRVIVGFPGGSTPDIAARAVATHLQAVLGQPVVVDNRAGGGGTIGADAVAKAQDGHTLGVTIGGPGSIARILNPQLPYDPVADLRPVSLLARMPFVLSVNPGVPVRNVAELIAHARANPGKLNYGSVGAGSTGHLIMAEFAARHGLEMVHVPFRSVPQSVLEVVAGRIEMTAAAAGAVVGQARGGQVRAIGVSGAGRMAQLPDVPALVEQGEPAGDIYAWIGLFAPANVPEERIARLATEAGRAMTSAETRRVLEAAGFEPLGSDSATLAALIRDEVAFWGPVVRRLNIRPES
ncbi:Bug family tripartite tricarboxylate transporter substrate binding protein [Sabulicella glaciei]|uniref:Tripartite tricarboxylate transporter substrate binding protein n=1 Tax=Sabulicella glaciei TaxID=2984948 RepID=A0ABT3NW76_9PROT|nr:tripartite tricarboxylate transporter substrate binding protein [Roseococcus sp. MDT2-1-1]MCW8085839.1 tripartite tricarboxylate transporter substrate binding protein [Roseococcus sp. MDT2-1-1]